MKNEKLLQMLGDIDEKHISEANRDVELWLEERNGVKVTVDSTHKRSPWRIITAASCSAAAVIGAFVLLLNVARIKHNEGAAYSEGDTVPNSVLSEQLADYKIENLDYENANVIEDTPISGKWQRMTYKAAGMDENSADRMAKIAMAAYGVTINEDDILLRMWKEDSTFDVYKKLSEVDMSKYDDLQYTDSNEVPYNSMFYSSDDIYIEIMLPGDGRVELDNRKAVNDFLGTEWWYTTGSWRPSYDITGDEYVVPSEHYVDTSDETSTCVLDGKTVKVADAVRNAQKIISESDVFPKGFDTKVRDITLYTYENGKQSLQITFMYTYDGVTFKSGPSHEFDEGRTVNNAPPHHFSCGMLTENTIDWIWFDELDGATAFTKKDCEVTVSREDALKLVSQRLSQNDTFSVEEIQLQYVSRRVDGGRSFISEPTWQFYITGKTDRLYAYVSAVDGTTNIFEATNESNDQ